MDHILTAKLSCASNCDLASWNPSVLLNVRPRLNIDLLSATIRDGACHAATMGHITIRRICDSIGSLARNVISHNLDRQDASQQTRISILVSSPHELNVW